MLLPLGMENGAPIGDDLSQLAILLCDRGVRYITLAHGAQQPHLGFVVRDAERKWGGLSPFGKQVVAEMNRVGIMVDVSHVSDDAVARRAATQPTAGDRQPFGAASFHPGFERNISDELVKAIAAKGGVVQMPFGSAFVNPEGGAGRRRTSARARRFDWRSRLRPRRQAEAIAGVRRRPEAAHPVPPTKIDAVLDQVDYAVKLMGVDHVGIGSDFDGVNGELPGGAALGRRLSASSSRACRRGATRTRTSARSWAATCCACGAKSKRAAKH